MHERDGAKRFAAFFATTGAALIAVVCGVFLSPDCAFACSCSSVTSVSPREAVRQALSGSDAVFAGEVVGIGEPQPVMSSDGPMMSSGAPETVTFRVSDTWKGAGNETVDVQTAVSDASCGYPFNEGDSYLVFASKGTMFKEGELEVALCGSTKPLSESKTALAALGPGAVPADSPPAGERLPDTSGVRSGIPGPAWALLLVSGTAFAFAVAAIRSAVRR